MAVVVRWKGGHRAERLVLCILVIVAGLKVTNSQAIGAQQQQQTSAAAANSSRGSASRTCSVSLFDCGGENSSDCIPTSWQCDGTSDCLNGADERGCSSRNCKAWQFKCTNSTRCISAATLCDGENDCPDGSDEQTTSCPSLAPSTSISSYAINCTRNEFKCGRAAAPSGSAEPLCIPLAKVCNYIRDCPLADDESACRSSCYGIQPLQRCSYGCRQPNDFVPRCFCRPGFVTKPESPTSCDDFDECAPEWKDRYCQHFCSNTNGSYACTCDEGYTLQNTTGRYGLYGSCSLVDSPSATGAVLYVLTAAAFGSEVGRWQGSGPALGPFVGGLAQPFARDDARKVGSLISRRLDFDYSTNSVCGLVKSGTQKVVYCYSTVADSAYTIKIAYPTEFVQFFAKEWISGNWYFADEYRGIIFVCNGSGTACVTLAGAAPTRPRDLAVDPRAGYLFYADWGEGVQRIERLQLDGGGAPLPLAVANVTRPQSLALDLTSRALYWFDSYAGRQTVERALYDGSGRTSIPLVRRGSQLLAITYFAGWLVVAFKPRRGSVESSLIAANVVSRYGGFVMVNRTVSYNLSADVVHLLAYHGSRQPKGASNPCANRDDSCSHVCVVTSGSRRCLCSDGYVLAAGSNTSCLSLPKEEQYLLYTLPRQRLIKTARLAPLLATGTVLPAAPPMGTPDYAVPAAMSYDYVDNVIYYTDSTRMQIGRMFLNGTPSEVIARFDYGSVEGIAVDWLGRNLFWINSRRREIRGAPLSNLTRSRLIWYHRFDNITLKSLAVDPTKGKIYWTMYATVTAQDRQGAVWTVNMDGKEDRALTDPGTLSWPNGLYVDIAKQAIYWTDSILERIYKLNLTSAKLEVLANSSTAKEPFGTAASGDVLFWSNFQNGTITALNLSSRITTTYPVGASPLFDLAVINDKLFSIIKSKAAAFTVACSSLSCSDLCVLVSADANSDSRLQARCLCADGLVPVSSSSGGSNCTESGNNTVPAPARCGTGFLCSAKLCGGAAKWTCDGLADCADAFPSDRNANLTCEAFKCPDNGYLCRGTYACLKPAWQCDGWKECPEGDDEDGSLCNASVAPDQCSLDVSFLCNATDRCIPRKWLCDGQDDCGDASDERLPTCRNSSGGAVAGGACSKPTERKCSSGRCIEATLFCDGENDCGDGSDETDCTICDFPSHVCRTTKRCLSRSYVCDSIKDCPDGSDEANCTSVIPCGRTDFRCGDGICIMDKWRCDGDIDCKDGSDEARCSSVNCSNFDFKCSSENKCISLAWRCDGDQDCTNNEDEIGCTPTCSSQQYFCNDTNVVGVYTPVSTILSGSFRLYLQQSACLPVETMCDGTADCSNPPDETPLCQFTSVCNSQPCSHTCIVSPAGGYRCSCPPGLQLQSDNRTCEHVNACQQWGRCSQNCSIAPGRVKCSCFENYAIEPDGFTCSPKEQKLVSLIFSSRHELRMIDTGGPLPSSSLLTSSLRNTIALDYHYAKGYVYWTDVIDDRIYRGTFASSSGIDTTLIDIQPVVDSGLPTAEGLAVDWIGDHIYWVESTLDAIDVADLDGRNRSTLIAGDMLSPRAIALDPRFGLVFWSDWGTKTIERADMTGKNRRIIFNVSRIAGAGWPNGLTLDYDLLRVYWIDARSDSVHTVTYNGDDLRAILLGHNKMQHPFAISVFGNYMYWTDWRTNTINKALKWNGSNVEEVQVVLTQPFDIKVYHPLRQPALTPAMGSNPCSVNNGGCSHLCLLAGRGQRQCACPHMMTLQQPGGVSCTRLDEMLVLAWQHEIRGVLPKSPSYSVMASLHSPLVDDVVALDHFYEGVSDGERRIFWVGGGAVNSARFGGLSSTIVADAGIKALAVDWNCQNIYFASSQNLPESGMVQVSRLNGSGRKSLVRGLGQPSAIAIDPQSGSMYIYDEQKREITCWLMNGTRIAVVAANTTRVIGLTIDPLTSNLYWSNGSSLLKLDASGGCMKSSFVQPPSTYTVNPSILTVTNGQLYYFTDGKLLSLNLSETALPLMGKTLLPLPQSVSAMKVFSRRPSQGACVRVPITCSPKELILPTGPRTLQCVCPDGFEKAGSGAGCQSIDSYMLYAGSKALRGFRLLPDGTTESDVLSTVPQANPAALDYWSQQGFIYWLDASSKSIIRIQRDLSDRAVVVEGIGGGEDIAVDWIAGNLYWTDNTTRTIEVSRLNGSNRYVVIHENLTTKLHSIAVHPAAGLLFFTNDDALERANMDGSNRTIIARRSQLNAVAVDTETKFVYLCSQSSGVIERVPISGMEPAMVVYGNVTGCRSLYAHDDILYWIDSIHGGIFKAPVLKNGTLGEVRRMDLKMLPADALSDIAVYIKARQVGTNPCSKDNGGCQGLCFYNSITGGALCRCTYGQLNSTDQRSCVAYKDFLAFSTVKGIQFLAPDTSQGINKPLRDIVDNQMKNVIGLAVDYGGNRLFISDIQASDIKSVFFNGTVERVLANKVGSAEGLSYEPTLRDLYFTRALEPSVNRLNVDAATPSFDVLLTLAKEDRPRSIVINACGGHVYWTNWNSERPSVQRAGLDGFWKEDIINSSISIPNGLAIDHVAQKLYWADAKIDKIERCNLDGTDRVVLMLQASNHVFAMTLYKDFIYWTDWQERAVMRANKYDGSGITAVVRNIQRQPMGIVTIAEDVNTCQLNPCQQLMLNSSAACEHECAVENSAAVCTCLDGYTLVNGTRCIESSCPEDAFKCPSLGGDCIPFVNTCDGVPHCVVFADGENRLVGDEDPAWCRTRQCPSDVTYFRCTNNRCVLRRQRCDRSNDCGDLSDEVGCTCAANMTSCHNGECVRTSLLCDGARDCLDGSDELDCNCEVRCLDSTSVCIRKAELCDGVEQCPDGWDESSGNCNRSECLPGQFKCTSLSQCIQESWRCDGDTDCTDGSDEANCSSAGQSCKMEEFSCPEQRDVCWPQAQRCDGTPDCADGSDEHDCSTAQGGPSVLCDNSTHFHCGQTERCVPLVVLCDGEDDCAGGSDERPAGGCPPIACPEGQVACFGPVDTRRCIDISFLCDGYDDCGDRSDELSCSNFRPCDDLVEFRCTRGGCVPLGSRCNGVSDCGDGSDEQSPTCPLPVPLASACDGNGSLWACPDGVCIPRAALCDGQRNCQGSYGFAADELGCGINECLEMNGGCTHICTDETVGYHCSCKHGFRLSAADNRTCEDVDECALPFADAESRSLGSGTQRPPPPCSQYCHNTYGDFFCTCADGYRLAPDKRSCKADGVLSLLVANRFYIRNFTIAQGGLSPRLLTTNLSNAVGIDFDYQEQKLYWSDQGSSGSNISVMSINGSSRQVLHYLGLQSPDGIAVDWVGRNLYWCDTALNSIEVSKLDGLYRKLLLAHGLHQPRSLQVHPGRGILFYADWGKGAHVGRMNMDGTDVTKIVQENLGWPNALAIDAIANRLYFGDAKKDYIGSCDFNGQGLRVVPIEFGRLHHIFGLTFFENHLYWTDWENMTVSRVDAAAGGNVTTSPRLSHRPMGIVAYHQLKQKLPKKFENPCENNGGCGALCLLRPAAVPGIGSVAPTVTRVCACPDNHVLAANTTCISMCTPSQYTCRSTLRCIPFYLVCDGHDDCGDGSDETACSGKPASRCRSMFLCDAESDSVPKCIAPELICNGVAECPGSTDEAVFNNCLLYTCPVQTMSCLKANGSYCLPLSKRCDGKNDCLDSADERDCSGSVQCTSSQFRCGGSAGSQCISLTFRCDSDKDCADGSDESQSTCASPCPAGYLRCAQSGRCIPDGWRCDGDADCKPVVRNGTVIDDSTDERDCADSTCKSSEFRCSNGRCIPGMWRCDYEDDCRDNSDEENCQPRPCSESEFSCKSDGRCVRASLRCNGDADCTDASDEYNCTRPCLGTEFQCNSTKRCIPLSWRCDVTPDCPDKSDELLCNRSCPANKFQCANSLCVQLSYQCDGADDCGDSSDEQRCNESVCLPDRFHCANSKCIIKDLLCNGKNDCGDGSDESHCKLRETCRADQYQCAAGQCIPSSKVCNGERDCPGDDLSDERSANMFCLPYPGGCEAFSRWCITNKTSCKQTKSSDLVNVTCGHGFSVDENDPCSCKDVDECLEFSRCSQICRNLVGGYECICEDGFSKDPVADRSWTQQHFTCIADGPPATLLLADSNHVKALGVNANSSLLPETLSAHRFDAIDVYLGPDQWLAFLADYHGGQILSVGIDSLNHKKAISTSSAASSDPSRGRRETFSNSVSETLQLPSAGAAGSHWPVAMPSVVVLGLTEPRGLAIDWLNLHVYWTDAGTDRVEMARFDGSLRRTVSSGDLQEPHAIAVEPVYSKLLFWTDWGVLARIWCSQLDGSARRALPLSVYQPAGLTVDGANGRLYWTDIKKRTIESARLDGSDRRVVRYFESPGDIPYMIDVFEDDLYVSMNNGVYRLNKFSSGVAGNRTLASGLMRLGDLVVVQVRKQLHNVSTPCRPLNPCDSRALCTATPSGNNYSCSCQNGWGMNSSSGHCQPQCLPCQHGGVCTYDDDEPAVGSNTPGGLPRCLCPPGFTGAACEIYPCKDYCKAGGICEISGKGPVCLCPAGYTGKRCEFSLCTSKQCQNGGTCYLEPGSGTPFCRCVPGFTGETCADKQLRSPCFGLCKNNGTCRGDNTSCKCLPGFAGLFCEKCQVAPTVSAVSCLGGVCTYDGQNQPLCKCDLPHLDPGTNCRTSLCSDKCLNGGTCAVSDSGQPVCRCHPGLFSGPQCQYRHYCVAGYCQNRGTCRQNAEPDRFPVLCDCPADYIGEWCESKCNVTCSSENRRCAADSAGQHYCRCVPGMMGAACNVSAQCLRSCFNGGECLSCDTSRSPAVCTACSCSLQFSGSRCETRMIQVSAWSLDAGKIVAIVLVLLAVVAVVFSVIGCYMYKRHQRVKQFLHLPLNEADEPLSVLNPLYDMPWTVSSTVGETDTRDNVLDDEYYDADRFGSTSYGFKLSGQQGVSEERQLLIRDDDSDDAAVGEPAAHA